MRYAKGKKRTLCGEDDAKVMMKGSNVFSQNTAASRMRESQVFVPPVSIKLPHCQSLFSLSHPFGIEIDEAEHHKAFFALILMKIF